MVDGRATNRTRLVRRPDLDVPETFDVPGAPTRGADVRRASAAVTVSRGDVRPAGRAAATSPAATVANALPTLQEGLAAPLPAGPLPLTGALAPTGQPAQGGVVLNGGLNLSLTIDGAGRTRRTIVDEVEERADGILKRIWRSGVRERQTAGLSDS